MERFRIPWLLALPPFVFAVAGVSQAQADPILAFNALQLATEEKKIEAVNKFFNHAIAASTDNGTAKGNDYWQTPSKPSRAAKAIACTDEFGRHEAAVEGERNTSNEISR